MGFFTEVTRDVEIDELNYITVRKLTFGEFSQVLNKNPKMNDQKLGFDMVRAAIVGWSGPGFEERPVSKANIDELPFDIITKVAAVVTELNNITEDVEGKA